MRAALVLAAGMLTACGERIEHAPQPGDVHHLPPIEWRIVDRGGLEQAYRAAGMTLAENQRLRGFVGSNGYGHTIIYTLPPRTVDDDVATTLGHELMHIPLGDYHR